MCIRDRWCPDLSTPRPAEAMTCPTIPEMAMTAMPIQNSVQFGVGIRETPASVIPARQSKTALHAAGDDPCAITTSPQPKCRRPSAYCVGSRPSSNAFHRSDSDSGLSADVLAEGESYLRPIVGHLSPYVTTRTPRMAASTKATAAMIGQLVMP